MNDVDFDELDKAVASALAGEKPAAKPEVIVHRPQSQPAGGGAFPADFAQSDSVAQTDGATDSGVADSTTDDTAVNNSTPKVSSDAKADSNPESGGESTNQSDQSASSNPTPIESATPASEASQDYKVSVNATPAPTISSRLSFGPAAASPVADTSNVSSTDENDSGASDTPTPQAFTENLPSEQSSSDDQPTNQPADAATADKPQANNSWPQADTPDDDSSSADQASSTENSESRSSTSNSQTTDEDSSLDIASYIPTPPPATPPSTPETPPTPTVAAPARTRGKFMDFATPGSTPAPTPVNRRANRLTPLSSDDLSPSAKMNDVEPPKKALEPTSNEAPVLPTPNFTAAPLNRADEPVSPFRPDVEVEKRPLGAGWPGAENAESTGSSAEINPVSSNDSAPLAPELSPEFVSIEENEDAFHDRQSATQNSEEAAATLDDTTQPNDQATNDVAAIAPLAAQTDAAVQPTEVNAPTDTPVFPTYDDQDSMNQTPSYNSTDPRPALEDETTPGDANDAPAQPQVPLLKSLPEQEVPAGGSIVQQHAGETAAPLNKTWPDSPHVPLLSAHNVHPIDAEHHTPWWVWMLVILGVLAVGALTGAAVFVLNPGLL